MAALLRSPLAWLLAALVALGLYTGVLRLDLAQAQAMVERLRGEVAQAQAAAAQMEAAVQARNATIARLQAQAQARTARAAQSAQEALEQGRRQGAMEGHGPEGMNRWQHALFAH